MLVSFRSLLGPKPKCIYGVSIFKLCACVCVCICVCACLQPLRLYSPGQCNVSDQSGALPVLYKSTSLLFTSVTFKGLKHKSILQLNKQTVYPHLYVVRISFLRIELAVTYLFPIWTWILARWLQFSCTPAPQIILCISLSLYQRGESRTSSWWVAAVSEGTLCLCYAKKVRDVYFTALHNPNQKKWKHQKKAA